MSKEPSEGAVRAAEKITWERDNPLLLYSLAEIIDEETAAPELLEACKSVKEDMKFARICRTFATLSKQSENLIEEAVDKAERKE